MLSEIDVELFPDRCEVIQIEASQRFVFPIMKNGSSSFYMPIQIGLSTEFRILEADKLIGVQRQQPFITFLRNPKDRFISGVNTYVQHVIRDNSNLDVSTIMWFVKNYLFLNRHYCPQFFWLVNLAKILGPDVKFELKTMDEVSAYTKYHSKADVLPPSEIFVEKIKTFDWEKLELYFYLDQTLLELAGQVVTFREIVDRINSIEILRECILTKSLRIANILNELS